MSVAPPPSGPPPATFADADTADDPGADDPGADDPVATIQAVFGSVSEVVEPLTSPGSTILGASRVALLEDLGGGGRLVRLLDGPRRGIEVVVPSTHLERVGVRDERPPPLHRWAAPQAAAERAESLLVGLLSPSQRHQRATAGTFWVHNRHGWFRLGVLYDIRFRSPRRPWVERSVCVVSEGYERRPAADLWAELVVVLAADPTQVVGVANWNREDPPRPPATDRAGLTRWLEQIRDEHRRRRATGDELHAAYLAYDTAQRLRAVGRDGWAAHFAERAAAQIRDWAQRWPDEAERLLAAHHPVLELADGWPTR